MVHYSKNKNHILIKEYNMKKNIFHKKKEIKINSTALEYKVYLKDYFWIQGIKNSLKLDFLVSIYSYVKENYNSIVQGIKLVSKIEDNKILFSVENDYILIHKQINDTESMINMRSPKFSILPSDHFWVKGIRKPFDVSSVLNAYIYTQKNHLLLTDNMQNIEISNGDSTIVFAYDKEKLQINLVTAWVGNRNKKQY